MTQYVKPLKEAHDDLMKQVAELTSMLEYEGISADRWESYVCNLNHAYMRYVLARALRNG